MRTFKRVASIVLALFFAIFAFGCDTYETRIRDKCEDFEWTDTEEKVEACVLYSYRLFLDEEEDEDRGDGFTVRYDALNMADVSDRLEDQLEDYEAITDYKNERIAKYLDEFNLRPQLERDKQVLELVHEQMRGVVIEHEFQTEMGQIAKDDEGGKRYDPNRVLLFERPSLQATFVSGQIEAAREQGDLRSVEEYSLSFSRRFAYKDIDPDRVTDPNAFVWKSRSVGLELFGYKVLATEREQKKPTDNRDDYIEGYRIVDGERESTPALKAFFPDPGKRTALVVIDSDLEQDGEFGYDIPNHILEVRRVDSVEDILEEDKIVDMLFPVEKGRVTEPPTEEEIRVEIARVRSTNLWEDAPTADGWTVPFDYRNNEENNYTVNFEYTSESDEEAEFRPLVHISKKWHGSSVHVSSAGKVVEYYRPRAQFTGPVKVSVGELKSGYLGLKLTDHKKITIVFPDGRQESGYILPGTNMFVEDEPFAIAYTQGEHRWRIEKSDGSDVFDKRREVAPD